MFAAKDLEKLATYPMPFGKYEGVLLIDLPEAYLLWFRDKGLPSGQLGRLMALTIEIKLNGLEYLLAPLKSESSDEIAAP